MVLYKAVHAFCLMFQEVPLIIVLVILIIKTLHQGDIMARHLIIIKMYFLDFLDPWFHRQQQLEYQRLRH